MAMVEWARLTPTAANFTALARLKAATCIFFDRLRGMETLRIFGREAETEHSQHRRIFVSARWKFCASPFYLRRAGIFSPRFSIALVAVLFWPFLQAAELWSLRYRRRSPAGFLALILAPGFQPLRDLGTFYHAKARGGCGAASG